MNNSAKSSCTHTLVIGGGQAGLCVGYYLRQRGIPFEILDANARVGDAWRNRWDSLRLFNPGGFVRMPGMRYPGPAHIFPTKDQIAGFLAQYARRFQLPVRTGVRVDSLSRESGRFVAVAGDERFEADNVVVAMSNYQRPKVPPFARELDLGIVQMHSHQYRNPTQLREGGVLVVGVGNSGAEIALEVARTHATWISGQETGHIPWPIDSLIARLVLQRLVRFLGHHVLSVNTPIGRKLRPKMLHTAAPLIRVKPKTLTSAGIVRVPRVAGVRDGRPLLADGRSLDVSNVIWCTGYHHGFDWIDLPSMTEEGEPVHEAGIVPDVPGLYFVGLHFLYSMTSATLIGVARDAERIVAAIGSRTRPASVSAGKASAASKVA